MRLGFFLVAIILCGLCCGIPTDGSTTTVVTTSASSETFTSNAAPAISSSGSSIPIRVSSGATSGSSNPTASSGSSQNDNDDDDDDDGDEDSQITGDGLNLPLSSAILLSSHHGHHVCLPDVVAFSLLGSRGYPLGTLLPYHHSTPQRLQQELMFLKAFAKAGQHVWKSISSGHGKHSHQNLGNIAKVGGTI